MIQIRKDFRTVQQQWPKVTIVWPTMILRHSWRGAWDLDTIDKVHKNANHETRMALKGGLGHCLPHPQLRVQCDCPIRMMVSIYQRKRHFSVGFAARAKRGPRALGGNEGLSRGFTMSMAGILMGKSGLENISHQLLFGLGGPCIIISGWQMWIASVMFCLTLSFKPCGLG